MEDRLFRGRRRVRIGAGPRAQVAAPGAGGYASVRRRGEVIEIDVEPGAAETIEFPGGERIELSGGTGFRRRLAPPFGAAALRIGSALIELERVALDVEVGDRAMWAWAVAALALALIAGSSYKLVRLCGDGSQPKWGTPRSLSSFDANRVRVRIGPEGLGSSRPQAGTGLALRGTTHGPIGAEHAVNPVHRPHHPIHKKAVLAARTPRTPRPPSKSNVSVAELPQPQNLVVGEDAMHPSADTPAERAQVLADAQSALLSADLRKAEDSFNRAAHDAPLDYDQLNWLGYAHYLSGEYDDAQKTWTEAREHDGTRVDAINNLAVVAKRRGDTTGELALLQQALAIDPNDCHASNSLALNQAKRGDEKGALATLARSDAACGGHYSYTQIQRAGILALAGDRDGAFRALEDGLSRTDTLIPIKEYEVLSDLELDLAFASLRGDARFAPLLVKYLPHAKTWTMKGG